MAYFAADRFGILLVVLLIIQFMPSKRLWAFDDDKSISDIQLKSESFLDINAHQFRKALDEKWLESLNGWRMAGGSIDSDRALIYTDMRLRHALSKQLILGLDIKQDSFYAPKPFPLPLVSANVYALPATDVGVSLLGTPAYDKRQADLGYAITLGRQPKNYMRFSWLKVDLFYNDKNEFDDSYYAQSGETLTVEGSHDITAQWKVYYDLEKDRPLEFVYDNQISRFTHQAYNYQVTVVYQYALQSFSGVNLRTMSVDKALQEATSNEGQAIDYRSLDLYWVDMMNHRYELTLGLRYDDFQEQFQDLLNANRNYVFQLQTTQVYSTVYHDFTEHQAWDLGLYVAWSDRSKTYRVPNAESEDNSGIEAKLRTSWQYHSIDNRNVLLLSMSFNLDDLINDPGDGGGIYFQSLF